MALNYYPGRTSFGLLPEPEGRSASFITSTVINLTILAVALYVGMMAKHVIEQHQFEQTELIFPTTQPPQPKVKVTPPPKMPPPPAPAELKLEAPKINLPKVEQKPALKPIQMEAKLTEPAIKAARPSDYRLLRSPRRHLPRRLPPRFRRRSRRPRRYILARHSA